MANQTHLIICVCDWRFWRKYPCNPDTLRPYLCPRSHANQKDPASHRHPARHQTRCASVGEQLIHVGIERQHKAKLDAAISSLVKGKDNVAVNQMSAFINFVEARRGKKFINGNADILILDAKAIICAIDPTQTICPP